MDEEEETMLPWVILTIIVWFVWAALLEGKDR